MFYFGFWIFFVIVICMSIDEEELIRRYVAGGMSEEAARRYVRGGDVLSDVELVDEEGMCDDELVDLNGKLAVKVIHRALVSGKVDNVVLSAAVRALHMLDDKRKRSGSNEPEDDMLAWVAEVNKV